MGAGAHNNASGYQVSASTPPRREYRGVPCPTQEMNEFQRGWAEEIGLHEFSWPPGADTLHYKLNSDRVLFELMWAHRLPPSPAGAHASLRDKAGVGTCQVPCNASQLEISFAASPMSSSSHFLSEHTTHCVRAYIHTSRSTAEPHIVQQAVARLQQAGVKMFAWHEDLLFNSGVS